MEQQFDDTPVREDEEAAPMTPMPVETGEDEPQASDDDWED